MSRVVFSSHIFVTDEMTTEDVMEFVDLIVDSDYEIGTTYPYVIRRKDNGFIPMETLNSTGYVQIALNCKKYCKHRLVAQQFIPNPDNLPQVDHINHDRTDYHIDNLRWVSGSTNTFNKSSSKGIEYEFIDDIPTDAIAIDYYDTRTERRLFNDKQYYYYDNDGNDIFYSRITDNLYKVMHINVQKNGSRFVALRDIDHKLVSVYIDKFKHQYDLE